MMALAGVELETLVSETDRNLNYTNYSTGNVIFICIPIFLYISFIASDKQKRRYSIANTKRQSAVMMVVGFKAACLRSSGARGI